MLWRALALALMLHALAFTALSRLPPKPMPLPPAEDSIEVEILAEMPVRKTMTRMPPVPALEANLPVREPQHADPKALPDASGQRPATTTPTPQAQGMVRADKLYSADILASPRSRQARKGLAQLAPEERVVQLCNLEAMEQVHRWDADFDPDFLVAYAYSGVRFSGETLKANGGAFRSKRKWFRIAYSCTATPDRNTIVGFDFKVGDAIPPDQWQDLGLPITDTAAH
ncbi:DUF930 domain-containing protein [Ensifer sp. HO-A22]|uniref:DUF930 domain-containing protein n=1 Tax=Ensifer oleiphilus TaxID=2742698 RepID=A0A7Y6Q4W3_9HYPH|nr:DUF930 domain-containing protein [Ensifer oleiphilus]NVD38996.1 DUF930 domain-containing protein [Ensifer oleiphilus]